MKKQSKRRHATAKQLCAVQTSRHLRVTHHKHTGHRLPSRATSYPTLAMILLCVGVFLASWTHFVTADSSAYLVSASVPGPAPTQAATIDLPLEGSRFTTQPIDVSGTCPVNTYITLYRNGAFSGTTLCQSGGTYSLQTGLFVGNNQLQARVFSPTDVPGPMSNIVNVIYAPPPPLPPASIPTSSPSQPTGGGAPATSSPKSGGSSKITPTPEVNPLIFKTNFTYTGHYTGTTNTWQLDISGGNPPYAISVDWGDGTTSLISRQHAGVFGVDHIYKKAGGYKGSYNIKFKASDAAGSQAFLQILAIVNDPPSATGVTNKNGLLGGGSNTTPPYLKRLFNYVWPGYGIVVLMLISFWLGERHELKLLMPRHKKARHRHA